MCVRQNSRSTGEDLTNWDIELTNNDIAVLLVVIFSVFIVFFIQRTAGSMCVKCFEREMHLQVDD